MNEKLNIQDLAVLLAEYTGKDKKEAELFLRELLAVLSDALLEDRLVKVKGLGTFRIIQVEERESIHVNTGERFLIPAHSKFTFTPDKDLKDMVNKPFASFETTELNEGVSFSDTEESEEEDTEVGTEADEEVEMPEEAVHEAVPVAEDEMDADEPEPSQEAELQREGEAGPELMPEPAGETIQEPVVEPVLPLEEVETIGAVEKEDGDMLKKTKTEVTPSADLTPVKKNRFFRILGVASLATLIGMGVGYYLLYSAEKKKDSGNLMAGERHIDTAPEVVVVEEPVVADSTASEEAPSASAPDIQPDELARVKIIPGSRLTLIALEHYGHKAFWVYIYEYNKAIIDNPNNISIGTELVLPEPSFYGIDAKNPESVARAKAKQAEINSKL